MATALSLKPASVGARYALVRYGWSTHEDLKNLNFFTSKIPCRAFQEIAGTYRRQKKCQVVAIAGSYGKTMVKDLLENMLLSTHTVVASPESFNSQIGVPLSLLTITDNHTVALIEVGISHKEEMDILSEMICADYSIITHIGKKHIVTLRDLDTIAHEMLKIVKLPPEKQLGHHTQRSAYPAATQRSTSTAPPLLERLQSRTPPFDLYFARTWIPNALQG